jgi:hypothetical protein
VPLIPRIDEPHPHPNTAFITPRAAPTDSRFITEAIAGITRLENTSISSRNARSTTTAMNSGSLRARALEKSTCVAVTPPIRTCRPLPASAAGTTRLRRWSSSLLVWEACGAVLA